MIQQRIGIQLWSVKEACEEDFFGTLAKMKQAGYDGVEFAGFYGYGSTEVRQVLDDLGLVTCGNHVGEPLFNNLQEVIDYNRILGNTRVVCPGLPDEWIQDKAAYERTAARFEEIGKRLRDEGMQLYFHNHDREFKSFDGTLGLDLLYELTSDVLHFELDTYWVQVAGYDPLDFMRRYGERCSLIHIKDLKAGEKRSTIVGAGLMDIPAIVELSKYLNIPWLIIEQEAFDGDPVEEVSKGIAYLSTLL